MLEEYVRKTAKLATTHQCTPMCNLIGREQIFCGTLYAYGTPPQGYWDKLAALASRYGYTMIRSPLPVIVNGIGTNGFTTGYAPREACLELGVKRFHVYIQEGLASATEFLVACHELTHMLLKHPPQDARHLEQKLRSGAEPGSNGFFENEMPAHLTAVAVAKNSGVKIKRSALCYLSKLVQEHRRRPGQKEAADALKAARIISSALNSVSYARAA